MDKTTVTHVGLNAHLLSLEENYRGAGINWYIYNLLCHLPDADPGLRYTAFTHESRFAPRSGMQVRRSRWSTSSPLRRILWEQLAAPIVLRRERVDLYHAMAFVAPVLSPCPTVVTVPDLSFLHHPETFTPARRRYLERMTRASVRRARRVIAISESTRRDVIEHLGVAPERVQTVYCGVDPALRSPHADAIAAFRAREGLPERFILFLGTIQPRKNLPSLIDAFARMAEMDPGRTEDLHLVIAGGKGWYYEEVYARAEASGLCQRIHFPGYVPEADKPLWYSAALCFCFPSLYEGFGLPPLEAMACGVPVVTSDASSLSEVVGDAGLTVPPHDVDALGAALHRIVVDPSLRADLARRGMARAARFTWPAAAQQTVRVYRAALKEYTHGA